LALLTSFFFTADLSGSTMYLVSGVEGQVSARLADRDPSPLTKGRFLPRGGSVSTDRGQGLELIGSGWIIRLGQGTSFSPREGGLFLEQGAFLAKPMRETSQLILQTSSAELTFMGTGAFIGEIIESGRFLIIGLTGETNMKSFSNNRRRRADLKPGQRVELAASGRFGKTVDLDLAKLVNTSRLISLMPHTTSFKTQLQRAVNKQRSTLDIGSKGPQVDVLTGLSYAPPKSTLVQTEEITTSINQPFVHTKGSPANTSAKAVVQKATKENSPKDYPLPFIPGPTPRFHAPPLPEPTLKEIFSEPPTKSATPFPGRIFNR